MSITIFNYLAMYAQPTPTEFKIAAHVAEGMSRKEIADHMNRSEHTINKHLQNFMEKTGCNNAADTTRYIIDKFSHTNTFRLIKSRLDEIELPNQLSLFGLLFLIALIIVLNSKHIPTIVNLF